MTSAKLRLLVPAVLTIALLAACSGDDPAIEGSPSASASEEASPTTGATASPAATPADITAFLQPGLTAETVALLNSCHGGDNAACDKAQEPGRLEDGHFSKMTAACEQGNQDACKLRDRLVEAELRIHCADGDASACVTPTPDPY
jgi:hypothetical protein